MKFISDLVGDEYKLWYRNRAKVFLESPTGSGKTSFVCGKLLDYIAECRSISNVHKTQKMLILCNRKMLRLQYLWTVVERECSYSQLQDIVEIKTYQELSSEIWSMKSVDMLFENFSCIVFDEVHFFYADSDFNGYGTFAVLNAAIRAGLTKCMLFLSATMDEVKPLILDMLEYQWKCFMSQQKYHYDSQLSVVERNYLYLRNYDYVTCLFLKNFDELVAKMKASAEKWIVFIDNKDLGAQLVERLHKERKPAMLLHAQNIDNDSDFMTNIAMNGIVNVDVLVTTSVLDNGVSIHDPEVRNVVIQTESRISFLQMLGRVRAGDSTTLNLYFVAKDAKKLRQRADSLNRILSFFETAQNNTKRLNDIDVLSTCLHSPDSELADMYRRTLVCCNPDAKYLYSPETDERIGIKMTVRTRRSSLYVNYLAKEKIGDAYKTCLVLYKRAMLSPVEAAKEQIRWISKAPDELIVCDENFFKEQEQKLVAELTEFGDKGTSETGEFKRHICSEYPQVVSKYVTINKGTISKQSFTELCDNLGFSYITKIKNKKTINSIVRK